VHATRVPFDASAAFKVACSQLVVAGKKLRNGDPFPWQSYGISRHDLGLLWLGGKIDVDLDAKPEPTEEPAVRTGVADPAAATALGKREKAARRAAR
jgi:hypothetical protein